MAGETLSASLSLVVDSMTKKSVKKALNQGVMKNLVTVYPGTGYKGADLPIWDASTGEPLTPPLEHRSNVVQVAFSPDGRLLATASWDNRARLFDARTGRRPAPPLSTSRTIC